uniref:Uncharacterized protein n=1 Tax=Panagrolaimus sp. PS1159 TaxID=55785 RepID=A0AC35GDX9_9BILA
MEYIIAAYKCLLKPVLVIDVDEDNLHRVHEHRPRIRVSCEGTPFFGLIHSGSKLTMMGVKTFERLGRPLEKQKFIEFFNIDGVFRRSRGTCRIPLKVGKTKIVQVFIVVEDNILPEDCLLGADFLAHFRTYGFISIGRKIFAAQERLASQGLSTPLEAFQKRSFVCCRDRSNSNYSSQTQTPPKIQDPMNESSLVYYLTYLCYLILAFCFICFWF